MKQNIFEILDALIDLIPNTSQIEIKTTQEDIENVKEAIESQVSQEFSFGNFDDQSIPANFYGLNYSGVNFFFTY